MTLIEIRIAIYQSAETTVTDTRRMPVASEPVVTAVPRENPSPWVMEDLSDEELMWLGRG